MLEIILPFHLQESLQSGEIHNQTKKGSITASLAFIKKLESNRNGFVPNGTHYLFDIDAEAFGDGRPESMISPEEMTELSVYDCLAFRSADAAHGTHDIRDEIVSVVIIHGVRE